MMIHNHQEPQHPPNSMSSQPFMTSTYIQVDLLDRFPVAYGGYSDIYKGKHEEEIVSVHLFPVLTCLNARDY